MSGTLVMRLIELRGYYKNSLLVAVDTDTLGETITRIERLEAAIREELRRLEPFTIRTHDETPCEHPACLAYQRLKTALEE